MCKLKSLMMLTALNYKFISYVPPKIQKFMMFMHIYRLMDNMLTVGSMTATNM